MRPMSQVVRVSQALVVLTVTVLFGATPMAAGSQAALIAPDSKVFLQEIGGFETDLLPALIGAHVPVVIVAERKDADFLIAGRVQSQERGHSYSPERSYEATLTVTKVRTGTVIDAFTVTADTRGKLARACAQRLNDRIMASESPQAIQSALPQALAKPEPVGVPIAPLTGNTVPLFVQGDFNRLADFTETLRSELRVLGMQIRLVQRGEDYEYNIVFVQSDTNASAVVLDRRGLLVTSVIDTGFRAKGVSAGVAKKLARRMALLKRE
jgi:hypothetical protein